MSTHKTRKSTTQIAVVATEPPRDVTARAILNPLATVSTAALAALDSAAAKLRLRPLSIPDMAFCLTGGFRRPAV